MSFFVYYNIALHNFRGQAFFHGPWYIQPSEVEHPPTRLFYQKEVFKSSVEDTNPMLSILGRCAVMYLKDFCTSRCTEVPEEDVYICESKYTEVDKNIRKIHKSNLPKVANLVVLLFVLSSIHMCVVDIPGYFSCLVEKLEFAV